MVFVFAFSLVHRISRFCIRAMEMICSRAFLKHNKLRMDMEKKLRIRHFCDVHGHDPKPKGQRVNRSC